MYEAQYFQIVHVAFATVLYPYFYVCLLSTTKLYEVLEINLGGECLT